MAAVKTLNEKKTTKKTDPLISFYLFFIGIGDAYEALQR